MSGRLRIKGPRSPYRRAGLEFSSSSWTVLAFAAGSTTAVTAEGVEVTVGQQRRLLQDDQLVIEIQDGPETFRALGPEERDEIVEFLEPHVRPDDLPRPYNVPARPGSADDGDLQSQTASEGGPASAEPPAGIPGPMQSASPGAIGAADPAATAGTGASEDRADGEGAEAPPPAEGTQPPADPAPAAVVAPTGASEGSSVNPPSPPADPTPASKQPRRKRG